MGVLGDWVGWNSLCKVEVEQVWVVEERLQVELVVVEVERSCAGESSTNSPVDKEDNVEVRDPTPDVETLNGQFSYHQ